MDLGCWLELGLRLLLRRCVRLALLLFGLGLRSRLAVAHVDLAQRGQHSHRFFVTALAFHLVLVGPIARLGLVEVLVAVGLIRALAGGRCSLSILTGSVLGSGGASRLAGRVRCSIRCSGSVVCVFFLLRLGVVCWCILRGRLQFDQAARRLRLGPLSAANHH